MVKNSDYHIVFMRCFDEVYVKAAKIVNSYFNHTASKTNWKNIKIKINTIN